MATTSLVPRLLRTAGMLLLMLSLMANAQSYVESIEKQVTGYGDSQQEAVINALMEAVQQVGGVEIDTVRKLKQSLWTIYQDGKVSTVSHEFKQQSLGRVKGYVSNYDVVSVKASGDKQWQATIRATIQRYKSPEPAREKLPTLAILPLSSDIPGLAQQLNTELTQQLVNSHKFRVLERQLLQQHQAEIDQLRQPNTAPRQRLRLGQQLGADHLLSGQWQNAALVPEVEAFYGDQVTHYRLQGTVYYHLIDVASQEIRAAGQIVMVEDDDNWLVKDVDTAAEGQRQLLAQLAQQLSSTVLNELSPIRIIDAQDPQRLVLNQGSARLQLNQQLTVHAPDQQRTDPDTSLPLRFAGQSVGDVEVIEVNRNHAIARWLSGDRSQLKTGLVLRSKALTKKPPATPALTPGSSPAPVKW